VWPRARAHLCGLANTRAAQRTAACREAKPGRLLTKSEGLSIAATGVGGFLLAVKSLLLVLCVFVSGCQCRPPTTGVMDGELRASPGALAFNQTWVGAPKTLGVEIVNAGRTPRVLEVTTEGEFFEGPATLALGGGEAKSVRVAFAPLRAGAFSGRVVLRDANGQLEVTLSGEGVRYQFGNARRDGTGLAGVSDVCGSLALKDGALYVFEPGMGAARFEADGGFVALQPTGAGGCEGVPVSREIVSRIRHPLTSGGCSLFFDGGVSCSGRTDGSWGFGPRDAGVQNVGDTPIASPPAVVLRGTTRGACTLTAAGRVWCWGDQLGAPVPTQLPLLGVRQLECGSEHCCALAGDNDVRCWGQNTGNELSTPGLSQFTPRSVAIGAGVSRLSREAQCAVLRTGGAVCWGKQQYDAVFSSDVPLLVVD
jgi:hypothetical protein